MSDEKEEIRIVYDDEPQVPTPPAAPATPPPSAPAKAGRAQKIHPGSGGYCADLAFAFCHPFRTESWHIILGAVLVYAAAFFALLFTSAIPIARPACIVIMILLVMFDIYVLIYLFKIAREAAAGESELPEWPDISEIVDEFGMPFSMTFAAALISYAFPVFAALAGFALTGPLFIAAYALSTLYFPMQFIALAMTESLESQNPLFVLNSIRKSLLPYFAAMPVLALAPAIVYVLLMVGPADVPLPGWLVLHVALVLPLFGSFRFLGLFYMRNRERLGWFPRRFVAKQGPGT